MDTTTLAFAVLTLVHALIARFAVRSMGAHARPEPRRRWQRARRMRQSLRAAIGRLR
jgi:hypothetical protein